MFSVCSDTLLFLKKSHNGCFLMHLVIFRLDYLQKYDMAK